MRLHRRVTLVLVVVFAVSLVAIPLVEAVCTRSSMIVERVLTYRSGSSYVYFRPMTALTNSSYYYCRILSSAATGDKMISEAATAKANRTYVNVQGTISSCPTTGTSRFIGDCNYIYMIN